MDATKSRPVTAPELHHLAESLVTPIDFDQLIADGILRKAGTWYEVLDATRLPDHARMKVKALKTGNRVKFRKPNKRLGKFLRSLTAPDGQEASDDDATEADAQKAPRRR